MTTLGINIKILLAKNKKLGKGAMNQTELAIKAGISRGHLSAIITGREKPSFGLLGKLATALDTNISDLLKED